MEKDYTTSGAQKLLYLLNEKEEVSVNELKEKIGKYTKTQFLEMAECLEDKGYKVYVDKSKTLFSLKEKPGYKPVSDVVRTVKIGFISNPRLVSSYSTIGALYAAYKIFDMEDVVWVNVVGNLFNDTLYNKRSIARRKEYLEEMEDLERRVDYISKIYPKLEGRKTHVVIGKRDIAYDKRFKEWKNQVEILDSKREDIRVEGREFQPVYGTNIRIYLYSVQNDDGVSQYYTYDAQRRVEKLHLEEKYFNIVVFGGYHIPFEFPNWGVANYVISLPSLIFQTEHMKTLRKVEPIIGCYVLELRLSKKDESGRRKLVELRTRFYNLSKFAKPKDFYDVPVLDDFREKRLVEYLFERNEATLGDLSRLLGLSRDKVIEYINLVNSKYKEKIKIYEEGKKYKIKLPLKMNFSYPEFDKKDFEEVIVGAISDTHINSPYFSEEKLKYVLSEFKKEKADLIIHGGDIFEGFPGAEVYSGQRYEITTKSGEELVDLLTKFFELLSSYKIPVVVISGNHDNKLFKQIGWDVIKYLVRKLFENKIFYAGDEIGIVSFNNTVLFSIVHPRGGAPYTLGTPLEKFGRKSSKSTILMLGNYHKACFVYDKNPRYLLPSLKYRDTFFETGALVSHEGAWLVKFYVSKPSREIFIVENRFIDISEDLDKLLDERNLMEIINIKKESGNN